MDIHHNGGDKIELYDSEEAGNCGRKNWKDGSIQLFLVVCQKIISISSILIQ